jgi:hypothetical protein
MVDEFPLERVQDRWVYAGLVLARAGAEAGSGSPAVTADLEFAWEPDGARPAEDWFALPPWGVPAAAPGWLRGDGRRVLITVAALARDEWKSRLQQAVPYAAGLQGKPMLHASVVATAQRAFAFVGASGAGKSTLAGLLADQGLEMLADDLIQVQELLDSRPRTPEIYFPHRQSSTAGFECQPLAGRDFLARLLRHGFSELAAPELWKRQFEAYSRLAEQASGFVLETPQGLPALVREIEGLAALLRRS